MNNLWKWALIVAALDLVATILMASFVVFLLPPTCSMVLSMLPLLR